MWGCTVDDDKFADMNIAQWMWYGNALAMERDQQYKLARNMVEYLASFWNSEAVQRIRDTREASEEGRFASDEEFEQKIQDGELIDKDLMETIREKYKNTNLNTSNKNKTKGARDVKLPTSIDNLLNIIKDSIE
tara:strand:- start:154 stop:555 length:402 start_codon:yes stop_codon:yes gene_type:complete